MIVFINIRCATVLAHSCSTHTRPCRLSLRAFHITVQAAYLCQRFGILLSIIMHVSTSSSCHRRSTMLHFNVN